MKYVIEGVLILILVLCIWRTYKKGLLMGIVGILAIVISLYVGNLLSTTFYDAAVPVVDPFVSGFVEGSEGSLTEAKDEVLGETGVSLSVEDAFTQNPDKAEEILSLSFEKVGMYSGVSDRMAKQALEKIEDGSTPEKAVSAVMSEDLTYAVAFILFFILTLIILFVIANVFNLTFRIPEHKLLNNIGGIVTGAVQGVLYMALIVWVLKFCGAFLPEAQMSGTLVTGLFLKLDLMSVFLMV